MEDFSTLLQAFINGEQSIEELQKSITLELEKEGRPHILSILNSALANGVLDNSTHQLLESLVNSQNEYLKTRILDKSTPTSQQHLTESPETSINVDIGTTLNNRFKLEERVGQGGMGVVFKATDLRKIEARDREPYVAIKILSKEVQSHPQALIALQRETKKTQKLAHPNIVTVYDFDRDGPIVYMTMEYLTGEPLDQIIRKKPPLPNEIVHKIIRDIVSALSHAHKNGIVHSDFKPGNIFILADGTAKILDFGIARAIKPADSTCIMDATIFDPRSMSALTPAYASCEILENNETDPKDDIYALGCIAYELLTGQHPFNKIPATLARDSALKPKKNDKLSRREWKAIQHAIDLNQESRTPTVKAFRDEFTANSETTGVNRYFALATLILLSVLISLGGYYTLNDLNTDSSSPKHRLSDSELILRLLDQAKLKSKAGNLLKPNKNNAFYSYSQVLKLAPENQTAIKGIALIKKEYLQRINKKLNQDHIIEAEKLINLALLTFTNDKDFLDIQRLSNETKIEFENNKIEKLISKARKEIDKNQLISPVENNAFSTLKEALAYQPNNQDILAEITSLLEKTVAHASKLIANEKFISAKQLLEHGLTISPQDRKIISLLAKLTSAQTKKQAILDIRTKADSLITRAQVLFTQGQLISPDGDNSLYFYSEASKLDSENEEAKDGISKIREHFLKKITVYQANSDFIAAENTTALALTSFPNDAEILAKQGSIQKKKEAFRANRINQLISSAIKISNSNEFSLTAAKNSYGLLKQALELEPNNKRATTEIQRLVDAHIGYAKGLSKNKKWGMAAKILQHGLIISPKNKEILALSGQLEKTRKQHIADISKKRGVAQLISKAKKAFSINKQTSLGRDNAVTYCLQALKLDPSNIYALNLLKKIGDSFKLEALEYKKEKEWNKSLSALDSAIKVVPKNKTYIALRKQIQKEEIQYKSLQKKLNKIHRLLSKKLLTTQDAKRAYALLDSVSKNDPTQPEAIASRQKLQSKLLHTSNSFINGKSNPIALAYIRSALKLFPKNTKLRELFSQTEKTQKKIKLVKQREKNIQHHLSKANYLIKQNQHYSPENSNAGAHLNKVLALAPNNEVSKKILADIYSVLKEKILTLKTKGLYKNALQETALGLKVFPINNELLELEKALLKLRKKAIKKEQVVNHINSLLIKANKHDAAKRWSLPVGNNALDTYSEILAIYPNHLAAKDGITRIENRYIELANKYLKAKKWRAAEIAIQNGFSAFPDSHKFGPLSTRLLKERKAYNQSVKLSLKKKRDKITSLLSQADSAYRNNQLTSPPASSAYELYKRVIGIEPGNSLAKIGIAKVEKRTLQLISNDLSSNDLDKAKEKLNEAQSIFTDNQQLSPLSTIYKNKLQLAKQLDKITEAINTNQLELAHKIVEKSYILDPESEELRQLKIKIEAQLETQKKVKKKKIKVYGTF